MKVRIRTHEGPFEAQLDYSHGPEPVVAANGKLYDQVNFWGGSVIVEDATAEELEALKRCGYFPKEKPDPRDERLKRCQSLIDESHWTVKKIKSLSWTARQLIISNVNGFIPVTVLEEQISDLLEVIQSLCEEAADSLDDEVSA
ncbi:hypothetical protein ACR2R6_02260 [Methylocaldum gracile subsp. desertum]|uniref:hypothetical protein n=1 Tax=Methylocaldum sp. GT1BW TaxID=3438964 RepID=UPI003DA12B59